MKIARGQGAYTRVILPTHIIQAGPLTLAYRLPRLSDKLFSLYCDSVCRVVTVESVIDLRLGAVGLEQYDTSS